MGSSSGAHVNMVVFALNDLVLNPWFLASEGPCNPRSGPRIEDAAENVLAHRVAQLGEHGGQEALREQRMGVNIGRERTGTGSHTRRERGGGPSGRSA